MFMYIILWLYIIILLEILNASTTANLLGYSFLLILINSLLIFKISLDLLALVLILTYSSVFLFLFFLGLYFNSLFDKPDKRGKFSKVNPVITALITVFILIITTTGNTSVQGSAISEILLWNTSALTCIEPSSSILILTHICSVKILVLESIILNIFLLYGLIFGVHAVLTKNIMFTDNTRVASIVVSKRSWRRSHSSLIR